ncbi:MAG TPA: formate--tetrahydrofolate ligase [Candidatus Acidoferrales bacterium]|jgi:formate--tetrahydrofolate ligase|nr:formate--tetrahydrofolate ligase [Candidatus Acidoferrales bacterium]
MNKKLLPIQDVARKLDIPDKYFEQVGPHGGKIRLELLADPAFKRRGKLIMVTATTPTASGEGKTVTAIGLTQGLALLGKRVVITSREPSLGPVFGMKGGAAGGGLSQIEPAAKVNLHFHGDFHAISSAHNLLAALIDAHLFHGNDLNLDPEKITWPRAMDMNDRALRRIAVSLDSKKDGGGRKTGFVITAASEIMAIVALAKDVKDLRHRLESIVIGVTRDGKPVRAKDLQAVGGMMALLAEAIFPNLVQTTAGTPALVHAGPFGNIAHGTSSVLCQQMGLRLADYVVNEAGFAADLGGEKYFDIVMQQSGITPSVAVLVSTVQSIRNQGAGDLERGLPNLGRHIDNLRGFGVPTIAAINRFPNDTDADLKRLDDYCAEHGTPTALSEAFTKGGAGAKALAEKVVELIAKNPSPAVRPTYTLDEPILEKIEKVARKIYGAGEVSYTDLAKAKLQQFSAWGYEKLAVCIAKTQYSFTDDPKVLGAPEGWTLRVTDASLSAGAEFIVVICGNQMLMPGLPKVSRTVSIDVDEAGEIVGV